MGVGFHPPVPDLTPRVDAPLVRWRTLAVYPPAVVSSVANATLLCALADRPQEKEAIARINGVGHRLVDAARSLTPIASTFPERTVRKIPIETKPALWGIAGGAVALAIVGFSWGGWVTGGKAEAAALTRANDAVVMALAPVCVDKFQRGGLRGQSGCAQEGRDMVAGRLRREERLGNSAGKQLVGAVSAVAKACAVLLTTA